MGLIVLTGFMGSGKSEVGRRLARRLGRAFIDTDELIEASAGKSVASIFADDGEAAFRRLERDAVAEAARRGDAVVALGGGAVLDSANVAVLRAAGVVICLTARPDTILRRVGHGSERPLLAGGDPRVTIERLLNERQAAYDAATDWTIDTSDSSVDEVVEDIRESLPGLERGERWKSST